MIVRRRRQKIGEMRGYTLLRNVRCKACSRRFERMRDGWKPARKRMAIYRFEAKVISRGGGRSTVGASAYRSGGAVAVRTGKCVTSAAAYRAAVDLEDERTGQRYDYTRKRGVLGSEIMLPEGAASWMADRS